MTYSRGQVPSTIQLNGRPVACLNLDEAKATYEELWNGGVYGLGGVTLGPGSTVIDAGANIGLFALWVHERWGQAARIHCFEPVPQIFDLLRENVEAWAVNAVAHPFGLSDRDEEDNIRFHPGLSLWSTRHRAMDENRIMEMKQVVPFMVSAVKDRYAAVTANPHSSVAKRISEARTPSLESAIRSRLADYEKFVSMRCRFRRLGDFLRDSQIGRVDLLKVDTEGDELRVLLGIEDSQWSGIRQIAMEVDGVGRSAVDEVERFLQARGYSVERTEQKLFGSEYGSCGFQRHRPVILSGRRAAE